MSVKSLENLLNLNDDGGLSDIIRHARDMGELVTRLQSCLAENAARSVVAANIRGDGELVVLASSPAWAAKLRFEAESLMTAARQTGAEVTSCTVRVNRN
jgi:hypothetical protein